MINNRERITGAQRLLIDEVARAIAHEEGFFATSKMPSISQRLNNPGCLSHFKAPDGTPYETVNGFVEFPDVQAGWRALRVQVQINVVKRRLTFREFFQGRPGVYAGFVTRHDQRERHPVMYARAVLAHLLRGREAGDITIDTPIIGLIEHAPATEQLRAA